MRHWSGTILGEAVSMKNSRRMVPRKSKAGKLFVAPIKSERALAFLGAIARQVPVLTPPLQGRLVFHARIYYASERPDLDEALILDALQGRIYENDRQIREKHVVHGIDRGNPRAEILVEEIGAPLLEVAA